MNGEEDFLYDDENRIQILVCSGNLGNAQPDEASWNHWVPLDGYCSEVIRPHSEQRYPFRRMDAMLYKKLNRNNGDEEDCSEHASREDQFDIIVFGMQESTFDQVKEDNNSDDGMNESNRSLGVIKALSSTTGKTVKTITKHSGKTLSALQTLSTSRDYIAKVQSSPHKRTAIVDPLAGDLYSPVAETPRLPDKEIPMTTTGSQLWHGGTQVLHALMAERLPSYERVV